MAHRQHHATKQMEELAQAYRDWDMPGLAEEIATLDYAPIFSVSRLSNFAMREHASLLLAQIAPDMVESLLDNTLVEKWKAGSITLQRLELHPSIGPQR